MKNRLILIIIALALIFLVGGLSSHGQSFTKRGEVVIVSFPNQIGYNRITYSTYGSDEDFDELTVIPFSKEVEIEVDDMAIIWLEGKKDTLAITVITVPSGPPVIRINGRHTKTGHQLPDSFWKYGIVVPEIEKMYR